VEGQYSPDDLVPSPLSTSKFKTPKLKQGKNQKAENCRKKNENFKANKTGVARARRRIILNVYRSLIQST
jgi:hypothetical protein